MSSTAVTPLAKPSAPGTPLAKEALPTTAATNTPPQTVPFPSPQTFDIIPPLHGLLLRLLSPQTNPGGVVNGARAEDAQGDPSSTAPGQPQSQQQAATATIGNESGSNEPSASAELGGLGSNGPPPLDIKNLPTEVSSIKIRIQKAHAVVESLPDIDRSVSEQEAEISELEDRIAKLKSVIADFGRRAGSQKPKTLGS